MSWTVEFNEHAGYDCMSAGYRVLSERGNLLVKVDVMDFLGPKPEYEEKHAENAQAKQMAIAIAALPELVKALDTLVTAYKNGCIFNTSIKTAEELVKRLKG